MNFLSEYIRQGGRRATLTIVRKGGEGFKGHVLGNVFLLGSVWVLSGLKGRFEVAVDGDVGILIEAGIGFEARFGLLVVFDDTEIVLEEADTPFKGFAGGSMFEGMSASLGQFDDLTVGYAGLGPGLGEVVGIELKHAGTLGTLAHNNVFAAFLTDFEVIHGAREGLEGFTRHKIAHPLGINRGGRREFDESDTSARQTVHNRCF